MFFPCNSFPDQPPLQYYLRAIEHQAWDRVDLVTNGHSDERNAINPVVPALEAMFADGKLPENMHFHKVGSHPGVISYVLPELRLFSVEYCGGCGMQSST